MPALLLAACPAPSARLPGLPPGAVADADEGSPTPTPVDRPPLAPPRLPLTPSPAPSDPLPAPSDPPRLAPPTPSTLEPPATEAPFGPAPRPAPTPTPPSLPPSPASRAEAGPIAIATVNAAATYLFITIFLLRHVFGPRKCPSRSALASERRASAVASGATRREARWFATRTGRDGLLAFTLWFSRNPD